MYPPGLTLCRVRPGHRPLSGNKVVFWKLLDYTFHPSFFFTFFFLEYSLLDIYETHISILLSFRLLKTSTSLGVRDAALTASSSCFSSVNLISSLNPPLSLSLFPLCSAAVLAMGAPKDNFSSTGTGHLHLHLHQHVVCVCLSTSSPHWTRGVFSLKHCI